MPLSPWMRRLADERGASMAEYALLLALIALIGVVGVRAFGLKIATWGPAAINWMFS